MSEQHPPAEDQSGFIMYLSKQSLPIRLAAFVVFIVLIVGLIVGATAGLYYLNVSNFPRLTPTAVANGITVSEFVTFTDDEAYPAAVASSDDGTLYTGSYVNGTVWRVNNLGDIVEIPETRAQIGSVIGIDIGLDGTVYVLDHLEALNAGGARIWEIRDNVLTLRLDTAINTVPISRPNDIAVDADGRIYLLDISGSKIVVIEGDSTQIWWSPPEPTYQIAGLAYDALSNTLLITDANLHRVYRMPVDAENPESAREIIYTLESSTLVPRFNGITVSDTGVVYVAAFEANEVWQLIPNTNDYIVIAGNYRGSSDVAFDNANQRIYVNNWDQSWLVPITFVFFQVDMSPRLPFSVDIITIE